MTEDLYSILVANSLKLFSHGSLLKIKNTDLDVSQFSGILVRSTTYNCTLISSNTKITNPIYAAKLTNEVKVRKDVINIILNNKFPDKDKILIKLFDDYSSSVTLIESKLLSKDSFIKIWNILFKDIIDEYKIGTYYD